MARKVSLEGYDNSWISRILILTVLIVSTLFYLLNYDKDGSMDVEALHGNGNLSTWLRVVSVFPAPIWQFIHHCSGWF